MNTINNKTKGDASISSCNNYRYWLSREWDITKETCLFVMLNPSTADATEDDKTITNCIKISKQIGYGKLIVVNLFAFRSTDPKKLKYIFNPVGKENDRYIKKFAHEAQKIIIAWGNHGEYYKDRVKEVLRILKETNKDIFALKITKNENPAHPARLKFERLVKYLEN